MGTVMNGNKLSGACVNGNVVSGLVKNGVTFYKKISDSYKRRIMVGDIFNSNSIIFSDIPDNFFNEELPNMGVIDPRQTLITGNNFNIGELFIAGLYRVYIDYKDIPDNLEGWDEQFYVYDTIFYKTMLSIKNVPLDKLTVSDTVISVNENITYRHLYIEDPNIRPVQVGDNIIRGTKLYYVFPDNISEIYEIKEDLSDEYIFTCSDGRSYFELSKSTYSNEIDINVSAGRLGWYVYTAKVDEQNNIIEILNNSSYDVISDTMSIIDNINIPELAKCILVDTTTLG